jgi:hypothetical protein
VKTFEVWKRLLRVDTVEKHYDKNIIVRRSLSIYFFNAELGDIQKTKVFLAQKMIDVESAHFRQSFSTVSVMNRHRKPIPLHINQRQLTDQWTKPLAR